MLNQFNALTIKEQSDMLKALKDAFRTNKAGTRQDKEAAKADKIAARMTRQQEQMARIQARLEKLQARQAAAVGSAAIKANKKPGPVTTYGAEDNVIAQAIKAKKAKAQVAA